MAVTGISLARISQNLKAYNLLEALRQNQTALYRVQTSLSTGLRFLQPSEDPLRAASAIQLDRRLDWMNKVQGNLEKANATMTEVDAAAQEAIELLTEAQALAVQATGDTLSTEERQARATVVDSLLDRLVTVGNRRHLDTYLFSGLAGVTPFKRTGEGVVYYGDAGRMETVLDTDLSEDSFTISGLEFFGAVSAEVKGVVDLDPAVTRATRLSDLNGARGTGVTLGRINVVTATGQAQIDLSGAATVGDVLDRLTAALPAGVAVALGPTGFLLTRTNPAAGEITISDVGGGHTAADLGLACRFNAPARAGEDLDPRVTSLTRLADLDGGTGLNLGGGLVIHNGGQSATITFDGAVTIEAVLNRINHAGVNVWARVSDDGRSINIVSRVSGADLRIEENGGQAATALGVRSLHAGTLLAGLNGGRGVETVPGGDLRITTADGTTIDVSLDGVLTLQDVLDRINAAGGGAVTAGLANPGNGIVITDGTAGAGTLTIAALNDSPALLDLGLDVTATGNQLVGQDMNPLRADSPFTALLELKDGMERDHRQTLTYAGERIDRILKYMQQKHGEIAAQARPLADRGERVETEITATQTMLSDVRDVDMTDAIVRFQQLQTALQANLSTASQVLNLSLLDYLD